MRTTRFAAGLLALTLTMLSSCSADAEPSDTDTRTELKTLSVDDAQLALLSEAMMGPEFTGAVPEEDDDEEAAPGCLAALDELDDIGAETEAEIEYTSTSEIGLPSIEHSVFSYTEIDPITERIDEVESALEGCTTVEETAEDGTEYALDVTLDTTPTSESAEEQITLQAAGTVTSEGQEFPIGVYMSSVRVENHVSVIVYTDIPEDEATSAADFETYVNAATERLATVAAGEEPTDDPLA